MQTHHNAAGARQRILLQKEIPPLPQIARQILCMPPEADVGEVADVIERSPEIAARIIGMANAAYFGWPGGVRTVYDAVYKVVGIKLVKSLVMGMAMGEVLDVGKCRGFRPERYWFTAMATAQMSQALFPFLPYYMKYDLDNAHMDGLLHNLGISVLAHIFPFELSKAFSKPIEGDVPPTTMRIRTALGIDHLQAGGWLARKWHLPRDIVCVMEHHKAPEYRGDFWPMAMLVGYCERRAQRLFTMGDLGGEPEIEALLGIEEAAVDKLRRTVEGQLEELTSMVALMATGE